MRLTKYTHACVRLDDGDRKLLVDPGTWAEDDAFHGVSDILITHEHADHIDVDRVVKAVATNANLRVHVPVPVAAQLDAIAGNVHTVEVGNSFTAAGFDVHAVGGQHAEIYEGLPGCANIGYVINNTVYHPGDSMFVPDLPVRVLLVPTSAPWFKLAEALDFVRAVGPQRAFSIHDALLSDKGEMGVDRWMSLKGDTEYARIPPGESVNL
jgi:L-ascorbate metabolism protein UlaG (beta-lactamase superfamily)